MAKTRAIREGCVTESGVDKELTVKSFRDGEFAEDPKLKCYFKCLYQGIGDMDKNGDLSVSSMLSHLPPNLNAGKAESLFNKCKEIKEEEACERAFKIAKCLRGGFDEMKMD